MEKINKEHRNDYALITGGTSGIGYELAKRFAEDGFDLILVARREDTLQEVTNELKTKYAVEVTPLAYDLFQPGAAEEIYRKIKELGIEVSVLVNDAGQGQWGPFIETDLERDIEIIQLNIVALLSLTKLFLKDMVARGRGGIIQVGSEAGKAPVPLLSVYAATKAFVVSFSAALANEMRDKGITITLLMPGATDTDFFHKAGQEDTVVYRETELAAPEDVARDGYQAFINGENRVISGAKAKMNVFLSDLMGDEKAADRMRKQMEPSEKPEGRVESDHDRSRKERQKLDREGEG